MATHADALALVYARSLYELADSAGGADKITEIADELEQVCELAREDGAFREFLGSPLVDGDRRRQALTRMFENRVTDLTLRFLLVLNQKGRLGHLESIQTAFDQLVQESFGRVEVDVFTAAPLGNEQVALLKERIGGAIGKEAIVHPYTDSTMLGGLKLRFGDQLIDASVSSRLRRMKQDMLQGGAQAIRDRLSAIVEEDSA